VLFLVQRREHLAVVPERTVHGVARRIAHQPVGTTQGDVARAGELPPRAVLGHLVVQLFGLEGKRRGSGKALAHLPHQRVRARVDQARARPKLRLDERRGRFGGGRQHRAGGAATRHHGPEHEYRKKISSCHSSSAPTWRMGAM
jgi:hypothetical protein